MAKAKFQAPKPRTKTEQLKEKAQKAIYKSPTGQKVLGYRKKFAEGSSIETKPKRHFVEGAVGYDPDWKAKRAEWKAMQKKAKAAKRAKAKTARKGTQAQRKASRSPGGFAGGGAIESYSAQVQRKYGGGKI
tara:strand:+ start:565 stop:960 length:396 start_codon:yes stop_codon:yes gene_type:complete